MRPYILEETNWKAVKETDYELAILPWGATEAHNYHLPYGTDNYQVMHIVEQASQKAWEAGAKIIVLPNVPYGINTGQMDIKLCMNMMPSTQFVLLKDIAQVLEMHRIPKLVIVNGHGGNHFKNMIRELSVLHPDLYTCAINWYQAKDFKDFFIDPGDHAGEMETAAMLHIAPNFVLPLDQAGSGSVKKPVIKAFQEGWVQAQRPWSQVTEDTGVGDPSHATAHNGSIYLDACIHSIQAFFIDLALTDKKQLYK